MNMTEFKKLINSDDIDGITLLETIVPGGGIGYEIWCCGKTAESFGQKVTNNNGSEKKYTSVDRALSAIKKAGWKKSITIMQNHFLKN